MRPITDLAECFSTRSEDSVGDMSVMVAILVEGDWLQDPYVQRCKTFTASGIDGALL